MTELKLEVLKLIHRHDLQPEQLTERADALVKWLQDTPEKAAQPKGKAAPKAKATTIDPLD